MPNKSIHAKKPHQQIKASRNRQHYQDKSRFCCHIAFKRKSQLERVQIELANERKAQNINHRETHNQNNIAPKFESFFGLLAQSFALGTPCFTKHLPKTL